MKLSKLSTFFIKNTRYFPQRCFDEELNGSIFKWVHVRESWKSFKGTDRLYRESIQCSGQILKDSFETNKTF